MADILAASADAPASNNGASGADVNAKRRKLGDSVAGIPADVAQHLRDETLHWAGTTGVLVGAEGAYMHAPCALLPYPFPASLFAQATSLAEPFNLLVDRCARDLDWLHRTTRLVTKHDDFTGRLLKLSEQVAAEGVLQPLQLGIYRSDYMIHQPSADDAPRLMQVELNTISSSFASLSNKVCALHRELLTRWGCSANPDVQSALSRLPPIAAALADNELLPVNTSETDICAALAAAHKRYNALQDGEPQVPTAVVMVVQPTERNVVDQRGIEIGLWSVHRVPLVRMPLADFVAMGSLNGEQRRLRLYNGTLEASVVYFRAGYTPNDYPSETEWEGRTLIERSYAIKCPSVGQHLAGTKKVQQVLASEAELNRFVSAEHAAMLRSSFAQLHGLDEEGGAEVEAAVEAACAKPHDFVLKPQREGGGNNLFDDELKAALLRMPPAERAGYILMERIRPPTLEAMLMKGGNVESGPCACELGIYGLFLGDGERVFLNQSAGHLLRVKLSTVNEGGVVAGFAALGSPVLYP